MKSDSKGAPWSECDECERQLPTLNTQELLRLGWHVEGKTHLCASCAEAKEKPPTPEGGGGVEAG